MDQGLLWFDDDPKLPVSAKLERAAHRYLVKFGRPPTLCYVHPQTISGVEGLPKGLRIVQRTSILRNCFWLGVGS